MPCNYLHAGSPGRSVLKINSIYYGSIYYSLTSPDAKAAKFFVVLGTVFPNSPITTLPNFSSPCVISKKTCIKKYNHGY